MEIIENQSRSSETHEKSLKVNKKQRNASQFKANLQKLMATKGYRKKSAGPFRGHQAARTKVRYWWRRSNNGIRNESISGISTSNGLIVVSRVPVMRVIENTARGGGGKKRDITDPRPCSKVCWAPWGSLGGLSV